MAGELNLNADQVEDTFTGDDLPTQGSGFTPTILPGIHTFQLPLNLDQLWATFDVEKKDASGNVILGADQRPITEQHLMLKMTKDNPIICMDGGEFEGLPASVTISTLGRKRGKKDDADAPVVADMTYFVRKTLKNAEPVIKRGDWIPIVNKYAGHMIRLETGLSAFCDPERTRYVSDGAGGVVEDPNGVKGCGVGPKAKVGARFYTSEFKQDEVNPETGERTGRKIWVDQIVCTNCGAALRGFFRIEKYLEPLATTQVVVG